jgi:hypothetical protein
MDLMSPSNFSRSLSRWMVQANTTTSEEASARNPIANGSSSAR